MNAFLSFMASPAGRVARIAAGLVLIVVGTVTGGGGGWIITAIGVVPLLAGALDVCLLGPLFRRPLAGPKLRAGQS